MKNNNFEKKVIFLDIDGTLLSRKHEVLPSTLQMIKEYSKTGMYDFYISTGRGMHILKSIEAVMPYIKGLNVANGGEIVIDNKLVMFDYIPTPDIAPLMDELKSRQISFGVLSVERDYMYFYHQKEHDDFEKSIDMKVENFSKESLNLDNQVVQLWLFERNEVLKELEKKFPHLKFFYWKDYGADVVSYNRDKGTGIKSIVQYMGYDINKTYAFGDSSNDIAMFDAVSVGIAMGNAEEEVKEKATYITESCNEDGIYYAFMKYIK